MLDGSSKDFGDGRWSLSWQRGFLHVCLGFVCFVESDVWVGLDRNQASVKNFVIGDR